jgi:hypothetical protein
MTRHTTIAAVASLFVFALQPTEARAATASYPSSTCSTVSGTTTCDIEPSTTDGLGGKGITKETNAAAYNHVVVPASPRAQPVLVLFLGGATSKPAGYDTITAEAAALGYFAIDLRYNDADLLGALCGNNDTCYTQFRGMTLFGQNTAVPGVSGTFSWSSPVITPADSVVNRLVNLIDLLATYDARWGAFLVENASSPYRTPHHTKPVLPAWNLVVASGHSEGSGNAAFLTLNVAGVRRAALFSGPNDYTTDASGMVHSAGWITAPAGAPYVHKIMGARNTGEGVYGSCTSLNWKNLGRGSAQAIAASCAITPWEFDVGDGSKVTNANGVPFLLFTNYPNCTALYCHDSTAADNNPLDGSSLLHFSPNRTDVWDYLLTADFTD